MSQAQTKPVLRVVAQKYTPTAEHDVTQEQHSMCVVIPKELSDKEKVETATGTVVVAQT